MSASTRAATARYGEPDQLGCPGGVRSGVRGGVFIFVRDFNDSGTVSHRTAQPFPTAVFGAMYPATRQPEGARDGPWHRDARPRQSRGA
jgi:hypothetical protein